jgi:glutathione peroxidase
VTRTASIVHDDSGLDEIEFTRQDGSVTTLADHKGDVIMIVNVASKCGLTPQYEGLQRLYSDKRAEGLTILGFPANDFHGQEPGTDAEIAEFCSTEYSVTFPVMSKISVVGDARHPLYAALTKRVATAAGKTAFRDSLRKSGIEPTEDPDVIWNFEKFLIARDGTVAGRFAPSVTPDDPAIAAAIGAELSKRA